MDKFDILIFSLAYAFACQPSIPICTLFGQTPCASTAILFTVKTVIRASHTGNDTIDFHLDFAAVNSASTIQTHCRTFAGVVFAVFTVARAN